MKIVIAPDSFKGSIKASRVCEIISEAAKNVFDKPIVVKLPVADGGEGTAECIMTALNATPVSCKVKNPLGKEIVATYAVIEDTAIMEMAEASGLVLINKAERNILQQNTFGTGQLMLDAVKRGCKKIYIGIGGSATNDGGIGFAEAIGVEFLDEFGEIIKATPENLSNIKEIDISNIDKDILNAQITILSDVTNPLLGENGATKIYGKQKGVDETTESILEAGLENYVNIAEKTLKRNVRNSQGAGAAGGLGAGLLLFTNAAIKSGIETILDLINFNDKIFDADLVITGEGKIDYQSANGKVVGGVGKRCKEQHVPCIAIVGSIGQGSEVMFEYGIDSIVSIVDSIMTLEEAIENAESLAYNAAERVFRMVNIIRKM